MLVEPGPRLPDFLRLATPVELSGNWDSDSLRCRLNFILTCGPEILVAGYRKYEANLKQCLVTLDTCGCKADFSDAYSYTLESRWSKRTATESDSIEKSWRQGGEFGADGTARGTSGLFGFFGKIRYWLRVKNESLGKLVLTTKSEQLVLIVSYLGGYWAVGDDRLGDPRHGGWLRERYFGENPHKPLCKVDPNEGRTKATVTITVWARPKHISIRELDADDRPNRHEARSRSRRKALKTLSMKTTFRSVFVSKARPGAIAALQRLTGREIAPGVFPLDHAILEVPPCPRRPIRRPIKSVKPKA